jgi:hypothetical protein
MSAGGKRFIIPVGCARRWKFGALDFFKFGVKGLKNINMHYID